jgi:hypothetical protein
MIRTVTLKMYDFVHSSIQVALDELLGSLMVGLQNVHTLRFASELAIPRSENIETTLSAISITSRE